MHSVIPSVATWASQPGAQTLHFQPRGVLLKGDVEALAAALSQAQLKAEAAVLDRRSAHAADLDA